VFNPSPIVPQNSIRGITGMVRVIVARMGPYPIMPRENVRWVGPEIPETSLLVGNEKRDRCSSSVAEGGWEEVIGGLFVGHAQATLDASAQARSLSEPSKQRRTQGLVVEETSLATNAQAWLEEPKQRTRRRQGWVAGGGWASCRVSLSRLSRGGGWWWWLVRRWQVLVLVVLFLLFVVGVQGSAPNS
jgi:hypothetical protein